MSVSPIPQKNSSAAFTDSKPHYELLDGLRGLAALLVLWYHVYEGFAFAGGDPVIKGINHGYLAVDFFFVLSGFVIGYAYDDRNYNDVQDLGIPLTGTKVSLYRVIDNVLLSSGCAHCYQITLQTFCPELLMIRLDTICKDTDIVGSVPFGQ